MFALPDQPKFKGPHYFLVRKDTDQLQWFANDEGYKGLVVSTDENLAIEWATQLSAERGITIVPSKVGDIEGETLAIQAIAAYNAGANCIFFLFSGEDPIVWPFVPASTSDRYYYPN